jgi:transcriptional regulator with XRE-family HTH domain
MKNTSGPGSVLKGLRVEKGLTLADVSRLTGLPVSTVSKIENDKISLTYDKLARISQGLKIDIGRLFGTHGVSPAAPAMGRRSIAKAGEGKFIETRNYDHLYPATDLLHKRFIPIIVEIRARSLEEFGDMVRHPGEEYAYVLEGVVELHTDLYAPVRLQAGDSIYFDSGMAHAYLAPEGAPCRVLSICSGAESQLIAAMEQSPAAPATEPADAIRPRRPPARRRAKPAARARSTG